MGSPVYQMSINLNVLNHLGLKLYSNVPAVLSEAVANSWDADATKVEIEIMSDRVEITDDGHGMTINDINEKYLTVGYKRRDHDVGRTVLYDRPVMGRKGIGKLSLFSIADTVEVQTFKERKRGFVMSAQEIEAQIQNSDGGTYNPEPLPDKRVTLNDQGTRIILTELKKQVSQVPRALKRRLARRFSIIGAENNFAVHINGEAVEIRDRDYFHKVQYLWYYGDDSCKYVEYCKPGKLEHHDEREGRIQTKSEEDAEAENYLVTGWIGTALGSGRPQRW